MEIYSANTQYSISPKYQDDSINRNNLWDTHLKGLPWASGLGFGYICCIPSHQWPIRYWYFWHRLFFSTVRRRLVLQLRQKARTPEIQVKYSSATSLLWNCMNHSPRLLTLVYWLTHTFKPFGKMIVSCCKYATQHLMAHTAVCQRLSALKQHELVSNQ